MPFQRIPAMLAAERRAQAAQRRALRYASIGAARIEERDIVEAECDEAREVERELSGRRED